MRNLVLLLTSGHTVRIALRDDDLTTPLDNDPMIGVPELNDFLDTAPAVLCKPAIGEGDVKFAYIEDPSLPQVSFSQSYVEQCNDYQRITVESGVSVQYG